MVTDRCYFCPFCRIFYRFAPQAADHGTIRRVGPVPTGRAGARSSLRDRTREAAFGEEACAPLRIVCVECGMGRAERFFRCGAPAGRVPAGPEVYCEVASGASRQGLEPARRTCPHRSRQPKCFCSDLLWRGEPAGRTESCLASFACTVADRGNALVRTYRAVSE